MALAHNKGNAALLSVLVDFGVNIALLQPQVPTFNMLSHNAPLNFTLFHAGTCYWNGDKAINLIEPL